MCNDYWQQGLMETAVENVWPGVQVHNGLASRERFELYIRVQCCE